MKEKSWLVKIDHILDKYELKTFGKIITGCRKGLCVFENKENKQ